MIPRRSVFDWTLEALSLVLLLALFATVAANWRELPASVPLHFGISGRPNRWGDRSGILLLPLVGLFTYILLTAASRYQKLINIPITVDRNAPEVQSLLLEMSIAIKAVVLAMFCWIVRGSVRTALGLAGGLGGLFMVLSLGALFLTLGFYLFRLARCRPRSQ